MQTAALLERPEPRRMAGRPVDWMVDIMVEGGVVPVVVSMEEGREKDVDCIPRWRSGSCSTQAKMGRVCADAQDVGAHRAASQEQRIRL